MSTRPETGPASMRSPRPRAWMSALSTRLATARSSSTGSVLTRGRETGTAAVTSAPRGPRLSMAAAISSPTSVDSWSTSVEQVLDQVAHPVRLVVDGLEKDVGLLGPEIELVRQEA